MTTKWKKRKTSTVNKLKKNCKVIENGNKYLKSVHEYSS